MPDTSATDRAFAAAPPAAPPTITIIIPVFNEEDNVLDAYNAIKALWSAVASRYVLEFIFTDNHSTDRTFDLLRELASRDRQVKVLRFNRNYGFQRSLLTGYRYAQGAAAVQIDCDLQDPPPLILKFIELWEQGHDVVVGIRRNRAEPKLLTLLRRSFYELMDRISEDKFISGAGDFRLVDRSILLKLRETIDVRPYVRGLISSLAKNETGVPFDRAVRKHGRSKFPIARLFGFAWDGIVGHSILPLRLATYIGLAISFLTFFLTIFYIFGALLFGRDWPSGFATTTVLLLFGISLNAIFIGIIGEYISRIYQQVRGSNLTVIAAALNIDLTEAQK